MRKLCVTNRTAKKLLSQDYGIEIVPIMTVPTSPKKFTREAWTVAGPISNTVLKNLGGVLHRRDGEITFFKDPSKKLLTYLRTTSADKVSSRNTDSTVSNDLKGDGTASHASTTQSWAILTQWIRYQSCAHFARGVALTAILFNLNSHAMILAATLMGVSAIWYCQHKATDFSKTYRQLLKHPAL